MNRWIVLMLLLLAAVLPEVAPAEDREVRGQGFHLEDRHQTNEKHETVVSVQTAQGSGRRIEVASASPEDPVVLEFVALEDPKITSGQWAVVGRVSYEGLKAPAYLELWNDFPDGGHYFSRTLADSGPMAKFIGTSAMRDFRVPFTGKPGQPPIRLALNLVFTSPGRVTLEGLRLVEVFPDAASTQAAAAAELTALVKYRASVLAQREAQRSTLGANHPRMKSYDATIDALDAAIARNNATSLASPAAAASVSADLLPETAEPGRFTWLNQHFAVTFCVLIGVCGVLVVPLRSLIRRGRGRLFVVGVFVVMVVIGVSQLFAAAVAIGAAKPADVWMTLLGAGAIGTFIPLLVLLDVNRQYKQFELRKLAAMDV